MQRAIAGPLPSASSGNRVPTTEAQAEPAEAEAARQELHRYRIVVFATCVLTRRGLALYLERLTQALLAETPTPEALERSLRTNAIDAVVADARDHAIVRVIGGAYAVPLLLVASTLLDGLIAAMDPAVTGVLFTRDDPATALVPALTAVTSGQAYRSPSLQAPFAGLGLTPREQAHVALEAQQRAVKAIADCLGVDTKTVSKYRQRLCAKLGLAHVDELAEWARTHLQPRERGVGE
jgi:DNA-binding NarL/FixJ family response regulator